MLLEVTFSYSSTAQEDKKGKKKRQNMQDMKTDRCNLRTIATKQGHRVSCFVEVEEKKEKNKVDAGVNGFAVEALQEGGCEFYQRCPGSSLMSHKASLFHINNVSLTRMYGMFKNPSDLLVPCSRP